MRPGAILLLFALLTACGSPPARIQLAVPQPSEAQLQTCPAPQLAGATPTDTDIALERVSVAEWGACNKSRLDSLIDWCRKVLFVTKP